MSKKAKIIVAICVVVILLIAVAGVLCWKTGVIRVGEDEPPFVVTTNSDGRKYTTRKDLWKPNEGSNVQYQFGTQIDTTTVPLYIRENMYYNLEVPTTHTYYYEFGKTIKADDGSYVCNVIGGASASNLASIATITNVQELSPTVICTSDTTKKSKTVAALIGDTGFAIVCTVYDNDMTYSVFRDCLVSTSEQSNQYENVSVPQLTSETKSDSMQYDKQFVSSVILTTTIENKVNLFADGYLYTQSVPNNIAQVENEYLTLLTQMSGSGINAWASSDDYLWVKSGDYYLGLIKMSSNMTSVLIGKGAEANCNVVENILGAK